MQRLWENAFSCHALWRCGLFASLDRKVEIKMSQDSIRGVLSRCLGMSLSLKKAMVCVRLMKHLLLVEEDAARTRELILEVLNTGDPAEAIDSMKILLAELTVVALHGPQPGNITLSSRSSSSKKLTTKTATTTSPRSSSSSQDKKASLVGTLSLPRPTPEVLTLAEKDKNSHSGSDIPSESSGSSEDEGVSESFLSHAFPTTPLIIHTCQ